VIWGKIPTGARSFSLSQNNQTGFGAQPASNSMESSPGVKDGGVKLTTPI
jgi:hypothetical protein